MSTKTIAVDTRVYSLLAAHKLESESFSKAIARLLKQSESAHLGRDVLKGVAGLDPLPDVDADTMTAVARENRDAEAWKTE